MITGERLAGKKHPASRVIKNFGFAKDEKTLNLLIQEAHTYKEQLEKNNPKAKILKLSSPGDLEMCISFNIGFSDVYGKAFSEAFSALNLKPLFLSQCKDLILMRIAAPASKRKTVQLAKEYGIQNSLDCIYKLMDRISIPLIEQIKQTVYQHTFNLLAKQKESIDLVFYDLTTLYFETNTQDEIRNFGFSKDGKHQHVQIMLAVAVTKEGLPIDYQEFPGNTYEGHTLVPILNKMKEKYQINQIVLVADAALMNKVNLSELDEKNIKYVIAAKIKNEKKDIKASILDTTSYQTISSLSNRQNASSDIIKAKCISLESDLLIAYHSTKRSRKDEHDREKDIEKIKYHLESTGKSKLTTRLRKPYVKVSKNCRIEIDFEKLEKEKQWDGLFGLRTNIKDADPSQLLSSYRGLWQVEQTFRIAKNNLEIRPVFHYSPRRIRAHLAICYMALALVRYVEFGLRRQNFDLPVDQLHLLLDKVRKVQLKDGKGQSFELLEDPPEQAIFIYRALNIPWHKKFTHLSDGRA